mmetsp:Transcript_10182/g.35176  ORF Transcript_10182/g.35176 Transcript_10182/m.35176 type:complete len:358 (+) Transcript_10182:3707-4780(+)
MANGSARWNVTSSRNTNIYNAIYNTSPPPAPPLLLLVLVLVGPRLPPLHPHLAALDGDPIHRHQRPPRALALAVGHKSARLLVEHPDAGDLAKATKGGAQVGLRGVPRDRADVKVGVPLPVDHLVGILAQDLLLVKVARAATVLAVPTTSTSAVPAPPLPVLLVPDLRSQRGVPVPKGPLRQLRASQGPRNVDLLVRKRVRKAQRLVVPHVLHGVVHGLDGLWAQPHRAARQDRPAVDVVVLLGVDGKAGGFPRLGDFLRLLCLRLKQGPRQRVGLVHHHERAEQAVPPGLLGGEGRLQGPNGRQEPLLVDKGQQSDVHPAVPLAVGVHREGLRVKVSDHRGLVRHQLLVLFRHAVR